MCQRRLQHVERFASSSARIADDNARRSSPSNHRPLPRRLAFVLTRARVLLSVEATHDTLTVSVLTQTVRPSDRRRFPSLSFECVHTCTRAHQFKTI